MTVTHHDPGQRGGGQTMRAFDPTPNTTKTAPSGYARYVGRVGALAVALGIGVAVANSPVIALADTAGGNSSADSSGTSLPGHRPDFVQYTLFNSSPSTAVVAMENRQPFIGVVTGDLHATDADDDTLTYTVTTEPTNGTVVIHSDGTFTYTADDDTAFYGGQDSFDVTVDDSLANPFHVHGPYNLVHPEIGHTSVAHVTVDVSPCATCTEDQKAIDDLATRIAASPEVLAAKAEVRAQFAAALEQKLGRPLTEDDNAILDDAMDQMTMHYATVGADSDPYRPMIRWDEAPAHAWGGDQITGAKYAGDNPDNVYRAIPIDGESTYVLTGRISADAARRPASQIYQTTADWNERLVIDEITANDFTISPDGTFTMTIGPGPGNDIQTTSDTLGAAKMLFVRDSFGDWDTPVPTYTIERISGPEAPPEQTFDQQVALAASELLAEPYTKPVPGSPVDYLTLQYLGPVNSVFGPVNLPGFGRAWGHYELADNEALVITVNTAGADYFSLALQDIATVTPDYATNQVSLNNAQAIPNADGLYRFVISNTDPTIAGGQVANWIDTTGLNTGTLFLRWQGPSYDPDPAIVKATAVKVDDLADLDSVLPADTPTVTPEEREALLTEREQDYSLRFNAS